MKRSIIEYSNSARRPVGAALDVGDLMPRITLPLASGGLFDSWDASASGVAQVYWLAPPPASLQAASLADRLTACEAVLHIVAPAPPADPRTGASWIVDRAAEIGKAFDVAGPLAIVVDAGGHVAALLPSPKPEDVVRLIAGLYAATAPVVIRATAPVLLLDHVLGPDLCRGLIAYWQGRDKIANTVGSAAGNVVDADAKRRLDVNLDEPGLFVQVRDALVRRVAPAIQQASHIRTTVIEAPRIGCYDSAAGGWFRRHRDNTSRHTAHRQFAISINLNSGDEYEGGELRFPEFGRQLYRPAEGCAIVFSSALLHEVNPVIRGRRFGIFTFLSAGGPASGIGPRGTVRYRSASPPAVSCL